MPFFKHNKDIKTEDLKLSDYNQIWTKFCFLDETGSLNNLNDPFFTLGVIKLSQPYYLASKILYERDKRHFHDEMHFNKLSKANIDFAKFALESFFDTRSTNFYSYTVDKEGEYFKEHYDDDPWKAYEELSIRLLSTAVAEKEIIILIADHITVPKSVRYEVNVKRQLNDQKKRLTIAGVCRFDSRSNDLLQLVDLMSGAISYDLKLTAGIVSGDRYKKEFVEFFKSNLGIGTFTDGFKSRTFNIFVDKDMKQRLPFGSGNGNIKEKE